MSSRSLGVLILRTIAAILLATVVYGVVATVATGGVYLLNHLRGESSGFSMVFAKIIGAGVGVYAAKAACDAVLQGYSTRSVCVAFVMVSAVYLITGFAADLTGGLYRSDFEVGDVAELITAAIAAVIIFWDTSRKNSENLSVGIIAQDHMES